jgi:hypothetical protein
MPSETKQPLHWTITWINRRPLPDNPSAAQSQRQPAERLMVVVIQEIWTFHWVDADEQKDLPKDSLTLSKGNHNEST